MTKAVKLKTKTIPLGNVAKEIKVGVWEWRLGGRTWRYGTFPNMNLILLVNGVEHPVMFLKTLNEAAIFTEGFQAGATRAEALLAPAQSAPVPDAASAEAE